MNTDVLIVGSGCSGLYCALKLPRDIRITLITKSDLESNDSFLAQGGMCMLKEQSDFDSFFEDTLKAGHYENDKESVEIMINTSPEVVEDLVSYGADFARNDDGSLAYTREGAHSHNRIIFHEDVTGKEITSTLLAQVKKLSNVTLMEYTTMVDIIERDNKCYGAIIRKQDGTLEKVTAAYTVMACGGVGGLYRFSTNFRHLTGDSLAIAKKHGIELKNPDYVQIHPTTFYTKKHEDRSFLISESVRGEGAKLLDKKSLSKPFPSSDTESSKPLSCKAKDIVTKVRAYRTALEIKLLHTCEINALSRDSCKIGMLFCKINSFPFFVQMIFALSYKEDTNGCKPINLYSGCVSSVRLMLLILLT